MEGIDVTGAFVLLCEADAVFPTAKCFCYAVAAVSVDQT